MTITAPAAPPRDPRLRRHSAQTVALARQMYGDGDAWTVDGIVRYFAGQGIAVSRSTVRRWVRPEYREQELRRRSELNRATKGEPAPKAKPRTIIARMRQLRAAGVTHRSIAAVLEVDHGLHLNASQVRYYLKTGREPHLPKRRAAK